MLVACLATLMGSLALAGPAGAAMSDISSLQTAAGIACASASTCYVVGADLNDAPAVLTVTAGNPGATAEFADPNFEPFAVACPDATHCVVVGEDLDPNSGQQVGAVATLTGGTPGTVQTVPSASSLAAVGCAGYGHCVAAGLDQGGVGGTVPILGGQPQALTDIPGGAFQPSAVACPSAGQCLVAGQVGTASGTAGALSVVSSGTPGTPVAGSTAQLTGVACSGGSACVTSGVTNNGVDSFGDPIPVPSLTDVSAGGFGASWNYGSYSPGGMAAIACAPTTVCLAIGDDDNGDEFAVPVQKGQAGTAATIPADPTIGSGVVLSALDCPSASTCLAIGLDQSDNPVLATLAVPEFHSTAPASGGTGGSGSGSGGPSSGGPGGHHRTPTRLLISVSWPHTGAVHHITITVRCQNALTLGAVDGVRVRLQDRRAGGRGAWHALAGAITRGRGTARFRVPARRGRRISYRARFTGTGAYAGSVSAVKTVSVVG